MDIHAARLIYFSPTQTTQQVVEGIAQAFPVERRRLDLTPPSAMADGLEEMRGELAVIGMPVYGGRVPVEAVPRLRRLRAHATPAVVVAVYGNREYDDALLELKDLAEELGCVPVAGAAFIGAHTANYALDEATPPVAKGRPDQVDLQRARAFGEAVWRKVREAHTLDEIPPLHVPGHFPYVEESWSKAAPASLDASCNRCGTCASVCPMGAIAVGDEVETDEQACILCCACVKHCPSGARVCDHTWMRQAGEWLSANHRERKEPEVYL
jgi:ferredoxin